MARAKYKLAVLYAERGMKSESDEYKAQALEIRARLRPEVKEAAFKEEKFMELCVWMLW